jgi:hypothetical protein
MHFVRIGKKALNIDSVSYCEAQIWQDEMSLKVHFVGSANNTPLVLAEEDAKQLWKYLEYVAEKPVNTLTASTPYSLINYTLASLFDPYGRLRPLWL